MKKMRTFLTEATLPEFADYPKAQSENLIGYVFLTFDRSLTVFNEWILGGRGDSWFAVPPRDKRPSAGYGLMIRDLKLIKEVHTDEIENFRIFSTSMMYIPVEYSTLPYDELAQHAEKERVWLWIHKRFDPKDVMGFVDNHMRYWVP